MDEIYSGFNNYLVLNLISHSLFSTEKSKLNEIFNHFFSVFLIGSCCKEDHDLNRLIEFCKKAIIDLDPSEGDYYKYRKHKAIWDCQSIKSYRFVNIRSNQLCAGSEHLVEVRNDEIIRSELVVVGFDTLGCTLRTIDELFEIIEVATDDRIPIFFPGSPADEAPFVAHRLIIEYDPDLGYPSSGYIDYIFGIADEEFSFAIRDLEIIERR